MSTGEKYTGFSLFELIVVLAIISLMATLAVPSMQSIVQRNQKAGALNSVFGALSFARMEAVTQQTNVVMCGSNDQASCNTSQFEDGWIIFVDDGAGGGAAGDNIRHADELRLRVMEGIAGDVQIRTLNFDQNGDGDTTDDIDQNSIGFDDDGMSPSRGTIRVCDDASISAAVLNLSGQARLSVDTNADGNVEDDAGVEITAC